MTSGTTTASLTGLPSRTSYTYQAYRKSRSNSADEIALHTFITVGVSIPTALGASKANSETTIRWTRPANETGSIGYTVRCSTDAGTTRTACNGTFSSAAGDYYTEYTVSSVGANACAPAPSAASCTAPGWIGSINCRRLWVRQPAGPDAGAARNAGLFPLV